MDYSGFGLTGHNGVDWACTLGEPIYWDCDKKGTVILTNNDATAGVGCDIITEDSDGIFKHTFWHFLLNGLKVRAGQTIDSGELIGFGNSTGWSTGNHLHRQLKKQGKDSLGRYYNLNQNNGYQGAIDLTPYFDNLFIRDIMKELLNKQISIIRRMIEILQKMQLLIK